MSENKTQQKSYRPSLFFPLLLISLGLLLLLENLGIISEDIWDLLWKSWPVLLILIGVDSLFKRHGVAGPVFFIGVGVILLLSNFNLLTYNTWDLLFQLWPVMLIAWGLDLVIGRRSWWGAIAALALLGLVIAAVLFLGGVATPPAMTSMDWQPEGNITLLTATLKPAVGTLQVDSTSNTNYLVQGEIYHREGVAIEKVMTENNGQATLTLSIPSETMMNPLNQTSLPDWRLNFNEDVPLDLTVDMGVGNAYLKLESIQLVDLDVKMGVGGTKIWLPGETFTANVEGGVGETVIYVPDDVAVRLEADTGVTVLSLPPAFDETGEDIYEYRTNQNNLPLITIYVNQGVGRLAIAFDN